MNKRKIKNISKVFGVQKTPNSSVYIFSKGKNFFSKILRVLIELGLKDAESSLGEYINDKLTFPNPIGLVDVRKQIKNENYDVHLIFSYKKIFMIIFSKEEKQKEISDVLFKHFKIKSRGGNF